MKRLEYALFYTAIFICIFLHSMQGFAGTLLLIILISIYAFLFNRNCVLSFILCIIVLSNPGGLERSDFNLPAYASIFEIFFILSFILLFSTDLASIKIDRNTQKLFPYLLIFSFYQIIISLIYKTKPIGIGEFLSSINQVKLLIFGIWFIIPSYKVIMKDFRLFINQIIILALIYAIVFLISIYSNYEIISITRESRFSDLSFTRNIIQNAEIFKLVIFIAFGFLLNKFNPNKTILISGILTLSLTFISLFRLEIFFTLLTIFLLSIFINRYLNPGLGVYIKILMFTSFTIFLLYYLASDFFIGLSVTFIKTFQEILGSQSQGTTQTRTIIELPKHIFFIKNNPFFGTGFIQAWFENFFNKYDLGLTDIPLTSTLAMYGIIGMLIYYFRFYIIYKNIIHIFKYIKQFKIIMIDFYIFEIVTLFALSAYFISMIAFRLFYISWELTIGEKQIEFGLFLGIFFALINKIKHVKQ